MAPPVTPSPRRFLPASRTQTTSNRHPKPHPRFSQGAGLSQEPPGTTTPQSSHAHPAPSQFAPPPRFSQRKPKCSTHQNATAPSPPRTNLAQALRPPRVREDVEEAPSSDNEQDDHPNDHEEMLLTTKPPEHVHDSIEQQHNSPTTTNTTALPFSPKRRRLSSPPHPRFAPPTNPPSTSTATTTTTASTSTRPSFLRPPTPPPPPAPLPQAFSPHRRGAAFVPGGTASTVQAWVVAAGQSYAQGRRPQYQNLNSQLLQQVQRPDKANCEDGWGFKVKVLQAERVEGKGWRVLGLRVGDGGGEVVRCLLVGEGKGSVRIGGLVGGGGLGWRVCLDGDGDGEGGREGEEWWVGVGWEGE